MKDKSNNSGFVVKIIKLDIGDTLITKVKKSEESMILKDPMMMVYIPIMDKSGNISNTDIAFRDWIEGSAKNEFLVSSKRIVTETDPDPTILKTYKKILSQDKKFFDENYLKETNDLIDFPKDLKDLNFPDLEKFKEGEDEDDLDMNDWDDFPPRFK